MVRNMVVEGKYNLNRKVSAQSRRKLLQDLNNCLSDIFSQKEYLYTCVTKYLARMYDSIYDNQAIMNALAYIKNMDTYTFKHSIDVAFYSMSIAIWMGLSEENIVDATQAGLLHDIGKIYIPNCILNKTTRLSYQEYECMKKHTLYGYYLLNEYTQLNKNVKRAVLFHHERIDANGYPLKASQDFVGSISKIVAVADVYDAMTTERIYKKAATPLEALTFLNDEGREILDNRIIDTFLQNIPVYESE